MLKKIESTRGRTISIRIPLDVYEELERLKEKAEQLGHTVSITEEVTEAVKKVCREVKAELAQLGMKTQVRQEQNYDKAQKEITVKAS